MNIKALMAGVFIAGITLASTAKSDVGNIYAGVSLGNASPEESGFDSAMGWKIFGGYEISPNLAVEGGYSSFGEMDGPVILGYSTSVEATGFEGAVVGSFPVNNQFSLFGKLGLLAWDFKVNVDGLGSDSTSGTDVFFGLGGKYKVADNLSVRAAWEGYTVEEGNIDVLSVGVVYNLK